MTATGEPELPPGYAADAPTIETTRIESCPICGSNDRSHYAEGFDYEIQTCRNSWNLWQCRECTGVWLDPRPDVKHLATIYPPSYYAYDMSERISPFILRGKEFLDRRKLDGVLRRLDRQPTSYLDVGCGDGRYLRQFAARGLSKDRIYGIELSTTVVARLRNAGFQAFSERVEDCDGIAPGSLDLITMFHVIEHVDDPVRTLRKLMSWLAPGGVLVLETPNTSSLDHRLFGTSWWGGYHFPRHWVLFNERSIKQAFAETGLEPAGISYQTGHSFWLYSFHHMLKFNRKLQLPRLARWFDPMQARLSLIAFTGFDVIRRMFGIRTSAMLALARKREP